MVQSVTAESRDGAASRSGLLAVNFIPCLLLLVQVLLGMVTNLFVKLPASRITSVLGAVLILGAGFNGAGFFNYGQDFSSIIMAGLWAFAMTCYLSGLYATARHAGH